VWFAAVATVSTGFGALILQATAGHPLRGSARALFVALLVIAGVSAVFLLLTGPRAVWVAWRNRGGRVPQVSLVPELSGDRIRLVLTNEGNRTEFTASVVSFANERGEVDPHGAWSVERQMWPIPWDDDRSTGPKEIGKGEPRVLALATFRRAHTEQEANSTKWGGGPHWLFASSPEPVEVTYWPVATLTQLRKLRFLVTIQITGRGHNEPLRQTFSIGFSEWQLQCDPAKVPVSARSTVAMHLTGPIVIKASPAIWYEAGDDIWLIMFTVVIANITPDKTITVFRAWLSTGSPEGQPMPSAIRDALDREREAFRAVNGAPLNPGQIRPGKWIGGTFTRELRILAGSPKPPCTFVVMDTAGNPYTAPVQMADPGTEGGTADDQPGSGCGPDRDR